LGGRADRQLKEQGVSEQEREGTSPGATRSQHVVLQGPADVRMMSAAMRPGIERSREGGDTAAPTCLVITPTLEQALAAAEQARRLLADDTVRVVPVTSVVRARRILAAGPVSVVTGSANDLLALRRDAALDLQKLQVVVMIGLDDLLGANGADTLQALLGDAPSDVMRIATLDAESPEVEAFLDAQLRRARRMTPLLLGDTPLAVTPRFVLTSAAGRADALRAVLDESDPPSVLVVAASDSGIEDATAALHRLGVPVDGVMVSVARQPSAQHVAMTVLWESPASYDALVEALAMRPVDAVALLLPEELPAFRRMTSDLAEAWTPAPRKANAEDRVQQLRTALKSTLVNGGATASELALIAPLLESHDALEIAAAALRLYEGARRDVNAIKARVASAGAKAAPSREAREGGATAAGRQRVFLAVGKRDGARVGDIVGAVANEAEIPGDRIGQVELYESHAIVELAAEDAAKVVAALGSATLRGRRLSARIDERSAGERGAERGGERGERGGDRGGDRPRFGGGDRPRFGGGDRGERGDRGAPREGGRPPRTFGPPRDRSAGGDRGPRTGGRDDRPARSFDRGPRGAERGGERGAPRGGERSFDRGPRTGGAGRPPRAADERRAFGDRPIGERVENRGEWAERADRMKHARRPARPSNESGSEG
jgi:ATP-dependent RNA helicase DeaD